MIANPYAAEAMSTVTYVHYPTIQNQFKGFTLIEMAIVLIIMALLMMGAARGSLLLDVAREKKLEVDFRNIITALYLYQDKYRAIPGDDANADKHLSSSLAIVGNGNGQIEGNWNDAATASEASNTWLHIRLAGLLEGTTDVAAAYYFPVNALGSPMGLQMGKSDVNNSPIKNASGVGLNGAYILCSRGIPGRLVQTLDLKMDDGNPSTSSMMATLDTGTSYALGAPATTVGTGATTDINPDSKYIVCMAT